MEQTKAFSHLEQVTQDTIEKYRDVWIKTAKKNGWYSEPFYIHVWIDSEENIKDVVAHKGLVEDILILDDDYDQDWD